MITPAPATPTEHAAPPAFDDLDAQYRTGEPGGMTATLLGAKERNTDEHFTYRRNACRNFRRLAGIRAGGLGTAPVGSVCSLYGVADGLCRFSLGPWETCAAALSAAVALYAMALVLAITARKRYMGNSSQLDARASS
jgi:hypothetical protein